MTIKSYPRIRDKEDPGRIFDDFVLAAGLNIDVMVKAKQAQIMANEYGRLKRIEVAYNMLLEANKILRDNPLS